MNLVINTYGATLQKENDLFVVATDEGRQTFPPDMVDTISIGKAARITSDAIIMAIHYQVDILFVDQGGNPEGRVWSVKYGSISNIRKAQINFLYAPDAVQWVKDLITDKMDSQEALLLTFQPDVAKHRKEHNIFKYAINSIEDYKRKVNKCSGDYISDIAPTLRGWEGAASRKYFQTLSALMPKAYQFKKRDRRPAKDPFNALLNYAYGMLYGKTEGALIKAGLDPYVGIFHRDEYNRPALVFDFIEKFRAWMDYVVLQLSLAEAIPMEAFEVQPEDQGILLTPLAKRILIQSVNDYLSEIINLNGKTMSRQAHLEVMANQLAKQFLKSK